MLKAEDMKRILIAGAGTMGRQIALHFAVQGCEVVMYDVEAAAVEGALLLIQKMAGSLVHHQQITQQEAVAAMGRITATTIAEEAAVNIDLISESVPEDPALKGQVFSIFHRLCPKHTIFTTNTSTLLPSLFAKATGRPDKFLALHFHDLRVTRIVDIMPHPGTDEATVHLVEGFAERMGLIPIMLKKESSGYVFNAMFGTLLQAAQTLAAKEVASIEDIDRAWMGVTAMPIGPFGMMDSVGLETVWKITDYWAKRNRDPQSAMNADFLKRYVDRGELGQKSGKGFYTYPRPRFTQPGFIKGSLTTS
ncbi:MAG: 3-hydroxyacyl-CoA dehydrogenase [Deltaproteobacteria bacterium]|nr:3-hydroxyacyl-CoA dehydrogenase [Deltaproteobacteria bacterium]